MLKNYFNVAWRSLIKHPLYAGINIFGLALGISAFLLIMQYVSYEESYESHIPNVEDIYRVRLDMYRNGELMYKSSENYPGVAPAMVEEFPEVMAAAKVYNIGSKNNVIITRDDAPGGPIVLKHKQFMYAEEGLLSMLGYQLIQGDIKTALAEPFSMVISQTTAQKYFGNENPIGKNLRLEDDDFANELNKVTGVFADQPSSTHLKFDVLSSFSTLLTRGDWAMGRYGNGWRRKDFYTYVQLSPGTDPIQLEAKFPALVEKYQPNNKEHNIVNELLLQPIADIHLDDPLTDEPEVNGNHEAVSYLGIIAIFIIIIAWVNYINLSTARSMDRAREVGLRKVMGSYRYHLVVQFLLEAFVINGLAILLSFLFILIVTPFFVALGGTPSDYIIWQQSWFWSNVWVLFVAGSLLSGIYPAFVMSSFKPVMVLKGKLKSSSSGLSLRKGLVILQFTIAVALMIGTWTVYNQMEYMQNKDLGFNIDQTLVIERPAKRDTSNALNLSRITAFKNSLRQASDIKNVGGGSALPGKQLRFKTPIRTRSQTEQDAVPFSYANMDYGYFETMNMEAIAGRLFSEEFQDHKNQGNVLINETGARQLGFDPPELALNEVLAIDQFEMEVKVVGVLEDYHQESLKEAKSPIIFGAGQGVMEYYMVHVNTNDLPQTLEKIEEAWSRAFPGNPFEFFFLDQYFNSYYESERQFRDLFSAFAVLAAIIGCLGLFGLSSFTAMQRTREIAIRKVLGSSVKKIVMLLSRDFLMLVGLGIVIAWPLSYLLMDNWLANYPYAVDIGFTSFIASGMIVVGVALLTITYHILKSAMANPVESLKYE